MHRFAVASFAVLLSACGAAPQECTVTNAFALSPGEATGPLMRPGNNCLRCHAAGGEAARKPFSVGGTVFPSGDAGLCDGVEGVTIRVTDTNGKSVTLVSNAVGNFWSAEPLEPPLSISAERDGRVLAMPVTTPTGGCALCHSWPDPVSATGRIRAP
ncbi:MAG: hypothetical protein AB1730_06935 [Myxococcota bacterium]